MRAKRRAWLRAFGAKTAGKILLGLVLYGLLFYSRSLYPDLGILDVLFLVCNLLVLWGSFRAHRAYNAWEAAYDAAHPAEASSAAEAGPEDSRNSHT